MKIMYYLCCTEQNNKQSPKNHEDNIANCDFNVAAVQSGATYIIGVA